MLRIDDHPLLEARAFWTRFPGSLGELASPGWLVSALDEGAATPLRRDEDVRRAVRDMLRAGGYRPTGRGKPASEYLARAAGEGALRSINLAVDACNATSLHSGFPISVVDADRAPAPYRIGLASEQAAYVFNPAGQEIRLAGLLCLFDAEGPCANAVKDSQRTKTDDATRTTLSVVWGTREHVPAVDAALAWYRQVLERSGASTEVLAPR